MSRRSYRKVWCRNTTCQKCQPTTSKIMVMHKLLSVIISRRCTISGTQVAEVTEHPHYFIQQYDIMWVSLRGLDNVRHLRTCCRELCGNGKVIKCITTPCITRRLSCFFIKIPLGSDVQGRVWGAEETLLEPNFNLFD